MDLSGDQLPGETFPADGNVAPGRLVAATLGAKLLVLLRRDAVLWGGLTLVLTAPFFLFPFLPLYDLPNHIARQHILFGEGAPGASAYYAVHWRLMPNLAMEGVVFLLHPFVSVDMAVRIFLAATVAQLFLGTLALNRTLFGHRNRGALAAVLFVYNGPFLFGFANLSFGLGMTLWVFALWLRWRHRSFALPLFAGFATLILLAHLFAFGVYALVVGAYWLGEEAPTLMAALRQGRLTPRDVICAGRTLLHRSTRLLHLALPITVYLTLMPRQVRETSFIYDGWWLQKIAGVTSIMGFNNPPFDNLCLLAACAIGLLVAARLMVARSMIPPLIALFAAFLLLPHQLGEGTFVDYRMPSTIVLFLAGSTAWRNPGDTRRPCAKAAVVGLFAVHFGALMAQWTAWQPLYAEYRAAFALLPQRARLLAISGDRIHPEAHPPLGHIAGLAVTERGALIPTLFADLGHQLLVYRAPYRHLHDVRTAPTLAEAGNYDYLLLVRPQNFAGQPLPPFQTIARGRTFVLGRLIHP